MSHTGILDKIRQHFVNLTAVESSRNAFPRRRRKGMQSHNENRQEGNFNCEAFVDVSTEVVSQFFEAADPP